MGKTSKDIVQDLLKAANYYWHDENADNVTPLNPDDFDPVVDKIFKANAMELEKLYAEIDESQQEIVLGLSQALLPDQSRLPEPGYTVAQVKPKAARVHTDIEDAYITVGQSDTGERFEYYFTPLFEHNYPDCELVAIITDSMAMQVKDNAPEVVMEIPGSKSSNHVWLGLDIGKVKEQDVVSFFLGNGIVDKFDKNYHIFHSAKWLLNGEQENELKVGVGIEYFQKGFASEKVEGLMDKMGIPNTYEKQIFSRLRNSFIVVNIPEDIEQMKYRVPPLFDGTELTSTLKIKNPICWIKLEFSLSLPNDFLLHNFLYPNTTPLVNRRLKSNFAVKNNYDRILLPLSTNDFFLGVHKIQDAKNREEEPETQYQKVDFLHPDAQPGTYTVRSGSRVRRLNRHDASRRINRLLEVIQDEYSTFKEEGVNRLKEDFDVIDKAIKRVKKQLPDYFRQKGSGANYFCIANFRAKVARLYYTYWETQGELIKHLGDKIGLEVSSNDANISGSTSIIPIQHGKGDLGPDDYVNQLKIALLSRGRIMSKGDIELYCESRYGHLIKVGQIEHQLMELEKGQRGRGILVSIHSKTALSKREAELIRIELQNDLNAKSAFFTLIKVALTHAA